jgi:hypothetical protein
LHRHSIAIRLPFDCHSIAIKLPFDCHSIAIRLQFDWKRAFYRFLCFSVRNPKQHYHTLFAQKTNVIQTKKHKIQNKNKNQNTKPKQKAKQQPCQTNTRSCAIKTQAKVPTTNATNTAKAFQ